MQTVEYRNRQVVGEIGGGARGDVVDMPVTVVTPPVGIPRQR